MKTPRAIALLRASDGLVLWLEGSTRAQPGSTVKPLAAMCLPPSLRAPCGRRLRIRGAEYNCTHPLQAPMDLVEALRWSCNTWFCRAALLVRPERLHQTLLEFGLVAGRPRDEAAQQLLTIGLDGVAVTPLQLAQAYRRLAQKAAPPIREGLRLAAAEGTASALRGLDVAAKTGTAGGQAWCAGWAPVEQPAVVFAVSTPGRGATEAAPLAKEVIEAWLASSRR